MFYILEQVLSVGIFLTSFYYLYQPAKDYRLILSGLLCTSINFLWPAASYFINLVVLLIIYRQQSKKVFLINALLLSSLTTLLIHTLAKTAILFLSISHLTITTFGDNCIFIALELLVTGIFLLCYHYFQLAKLWQMEYSHLFSLLIGYLFIVIFVFTKIIQPYQASADLISAALLFILIQCTFIVIIFLKSNQTQRATYTRELTKEQLKNLKMYTDQLEHDQINLRKFERNYKNTIAGLKKTANTGDYQQIQASLGALEDYSNSYFDNISMQLFKDLNNVQNPYLKSLLISKLTLINQNQVKCHFECRDAINKIDINVFDLVRLLGISIDNALEATKHQPNGKIQIAIIDELKQLSFIINNTTTDKTDLSEMMQEGFTTKKHHSGLGLINVQDIKRKYPNLFVQYRKKDHWFNLNIVIIK